MSVAARSARSRRRLIAASAGAAVLALTTAACGFDDRAAVGTVTYSPKSHAAPAEEAGHGEQEKPKAEGETEQTGHGEAGQAEEGQAEQGGGHAEEGQAAAAEGGGHGEAAEAEGTMLTNPQQKGCHVMKGGAHHIENNTLNDLKAYVGADCTGESTHIGSKLSGDLAPQAESWQSFEILK